MGRPRHGRREHHCRPADQRWTCRRRCRHGHWRRRRVLVPPTVMAIRRPKRRRCTTAHIVMRHHIQRAIEERSPSSDQSASTSLDNHRDRHHCTTTGPTTPLHGMRALGSPPRPHTSTSTAYEYKIDRAGPQWRRRHDDAGPFARQLLQRNTAAWRENCTRRTRRTSPCCRHRLYNHPRPYVCDYTLLY